MKILQVMAGADVGGAETAFVDMCLAMREAGQDICVATRDNKVRLPLLKAAGIPVYTLPFGGRFDVYTPYALRRIIKDFKPDIVQTWMSRAAQKVPKWTPKTGIPRYLVVSRLGGYYKIRNFPSTDYFVGIAPAICDYLVQNGVGADKVMQISNFAETEEITAHINRSAQSVPPDVPLLLALGRLHDSKAFDTLIRAVADVPKAHLWIAGEGPDRGKLEALIRDLGLGGRVRLLGWRTDRAALFEVADICVFSSRHEPFGTVFVQAWGYKVPLVTTASDGPRQFVRDGEDGLLVPVDDAARLAEAINRLIKDQNLAEKLVINGYQRYLAEFTKEKSVRSYLDYFRLARTKEGL